MTEPRLNPATRALLRAAKADGPTAASRAKVWSKLGGTVGGAAGAGAAATTAAGAGASLAPAGAATSAAAATKMLAFGTLLGGAITVGLAAAMLRDRTRADRAPAARLDIARCVRDGGLRAFAAGAQQVRGPGRVGYLLFSVSRPHPRPRHAAFPAFRGDPPARRSHASSRQRTDLGRCAGAGSGLGRGSTRGSRPGRSPRSAPGHSCGTTTPLPPARARGARGGSPNLPSAWPGGRGPRRRLDAEEAISRIRSGSVNLASIASALVGNHWRSCRVRARVRSGQPGVQCDESQPFLCRRSHDERRTVRLRRRIGADRSVARQQRRGRRRRRDGTDRSRSSRRRQRKRRPRPPSITARPAAHTPRSRRLSGSWSRTAGTS